MNNNQTADTSKGKAFQSKNINKTLQAKETNYNYISFEDFVRNPETPDNLKILMLIVIMSKGKAVKHSNQFIANKLNSFGMDVYDTYNDTLIDPNTGEVLHEKGQVKKSERAYMDYVIRDGVLRKCEFYTAGGVSKAIKNWEREGILSCSYTYEYSTKSKDYKYTTKRQITINSDKLRRYLGVLTTRSPKYQELPKRSRIRKIIRNRLFSVMDFIEEEMKYLTAEERARYKTREGFFKAYIWNIFRTKNPKCRMTSKPTELITEQERESAQNRKLMNNSSIVGVKPKPPKESLLSRAFKEIGSHISDKKTDVSLS